MHKRIIYSVCELGGVMRPHIALLQTEILTFSMNTDKVLRKCVLYFQ